MAGMFFAELKLTEPSILILIFLTLCTKIFFFLIFSEMVNAASGVATVCSVLSCTEYLCGQTS